MGKEHGAREGALSGPTADSLQGSAYELDAHVAHMIRKAHQKATAIFQQVFEEPSLTPMQMAALGTLLESGPLSQNHLGRVTAMDPSTISLVVRKLTKAGLLVRRPSASDSRRVMIDLSDIGRSYTVDRLRRSDEVSERIVENLTSAERAMLKELLLKIST